MSVFKMFVILLLTPALTTATTVDDLSVIAGHQNDTTVLANSFASPTKLSTLQQNQNAVRLL